MARKFTMTFEATTINHLGVKLYSQLPPVLSELVSNAYDAEASKVLITLPKGTISPTAEIVIRDFGHGLTSDEIQKEYLPVGRNRRGDDGQQTKSKSGTRLVTGRKGLGKLSAFGIAEELDFTTYRNRYSTCLRINYPRLLRWASDHPGRPFEPEAVFVDKATTEADGVELRLRKIGRKTAISEDDVRRGLARRLNIIAKGFDVFVNNQQIGVGDRVSRHDCQEGYCWEVEELPGGGKVSHSDAVTGWIGFHSRSSQTGRGVSIFAHGKAVELDSTFEYSGTDVQFARAYLIGEVHADFLDEEEDLASTARTSVLWESDKGDALRKWGRAALIWTFSQWQKKRREQKETEVTEVAGFSQWLESRSDREQKKARRLVNLLVVDDPELEPAKVTPILELVKGSVETLAFQELIDEIEDEEISLPMLLRLFEEWRIIEAREHVKVADGRRNAIEQLNKFIEEGALEVQEMQPLFVENPWLINTAWKESDGQNSYTKLLRKYAASRDRKVDGKNRRWDILGITYGDGLQVVEIKQPTKVLSALDLKQIGEYVDWARDRIVNQGPHSPKYANGLLIVGDIGRTHHHAIKRLAQDDIRVETFRDVYERARKTFLQVELNLERLAPEYLKRRNEKLKISPLNLRNPLKKAVSSGKSGQGAKPKKKLKKKRLS